MKLFISYRRDDSQHQADRLHAALQRVLPSRNIFIDIDGVPAGIDFVRHIGDQVGQCDILLALIGPEWLQVTDTQGRRRLDDPGDFVRIEIATALSRGIIVAPVLLDGARMPRSEQLPSDIAELTKRNAVEVRRTTFNADTQHLVRKLGLGDRRAVALRLGVSIAVIALLVGMAIWKWPRVHDAADLATTESAISQRVVSCNSCPVVTPRSLPGGRVLKASEPIAFQDWQTYCAEIHCKNEIEQAGGYATLISWSMAKEYLIWLSGKTGVKFRLPTSEEVDFLQKSLVLESGTAFSEWTTTCHDTVVTATCSNYEVRGMDKQGKRLPRFHSPEARGASIGFRAVADQ